MKEEIKNLWVEALNSGEYEQGTGALCVNNKYCCLGVLCELAIKNGVNVKKEEKDRDGIRRYVKYDNKAGFLPASVREWAGLCSSRGNFDEYGNALFVMNDSGSSFKEIAEKIESIWSVL